MKYLRKETKNMKRQIRRGVFETNSSSTHSITLMMKKDYDRWQEEDLYLFNSNWVRGFPEECRPESGKLYTKEEVIAFLKAQDKRWDCEQDYEDDDIFYDARRDNGFVLSDEENEYLESYYKEFTTPNGDTVVAFGEYGYQG